VEATKMALPELEFFLLTIVSESSCPLSILARPNLDECVNRAVPEFSEAELIETLYDLFCCGDLTAFGGYRKKAGQCFVPTREEIHAALCGAIEISYELTRQGGERWERMSNFDWSFYVRHADDSEAAIEGTSAEMIEVYLASFVSRSPDADVLSTVRPWKATYWKRFPKAVRIQFRKAKPEECHRDCSNNLWRSDFHRASSGELKSYVPMNSERREPVLEEAWRRRFVSVAHRRRSSLSRLLTDKDRGIQYAAALRLAEEPDAETTTRLVEWFLESKSRFALLVISKIHQVEVLDALIHAFKDKKWEGLNPRLPSRRDFHLAIGGFGQAAVPKLSRLLKSSKLEIQIDVLRTLGQTSCRDAGTAILEWMGSIRPDDRNRHRRRIEESLLALARLADKRALPILSALIGECPEIAIEPLARFNAPESREILESFIDSSAYIQYRGEAAKALDKIDPRFAEEHKSIRLAGEQERLRRIINWLISGESCKHVADPCLALCSVLGDADAVRRIKALELLCKLDGEFPVEPVAVLLSDPVARVRANAAYALVLKGSSDDVLRILPLKNDESALVRGVVHLALRRRHSLLSPTDSNQGCASST
jgi:HEAT repeat protein